MRQVNLILILAFVATNLAAQLPASFKKCSKSSPDFNQCLADAIQDAMTQVKTPHKDIGIPRMEPLDLPELSIGAGTGAVNLVQNYKDVKVSGYTTAVIKGADLDFDKKTLKLDLYFDFVKLEANYDIKGKILLLPVYGKGPCELIMEKVSGTNTFTFDIIEKKGKKFINIIGSELVFEPQLCKYRFDNLFDGNKELGDNINTVINDNWKEVFEDVRNGYQSAFAQIHRGIAKNVFSKVSIEDLFGN